MFYGKARLQFFFLFNNDFFARKNNNNKTKRGCEMNQLEMTVDESLQSKH